MRETTLKILGLLLLLGVPALAAPLLTPATVDPMKMDDATFERELVARFQYRAPAPPKETADQKAGQLADARYFEVYPDYDRAFTPAGRAEAKRLAHKLTADATSLSHEQFVLRVAEIAALADNGHTSVGEATFMKNTPRVAVRTYLFADGLYVLRAKPQHQDLLGARVDTIEGHPVEDIFKAIGRYHGGTEMHRRLRLLPMVESPAYLQAIGLAASRDALTYRGVRADGSPFEVRLTAEERGRAATISFPQRYLYPQDKPSIDGFVGFNPPGRPVSITEPTKFFTLAALPKGGLYIRIARNSNSDEEEIAPFLKTALERVKHDHPRYAVVDMRINAGGDYTQTYDFARELPQALGPDARLYVMTSPWTFSAAITTAGALKQFGGKRTVLVGEPVGDRLEFWAEGGVFELPNAFIAVFFASGKHDYAKPCNDWSSCFWLNYHFPVQVDDLDPDVPVAQTFAAYRQGRDPAMDAVLSREAAR